MSATVTPSRSITSGASRWFQLSLVAGALLTCFDAFLLQERKAFFTGGFLAIDHARSAGEVVLFLALSLLTDTAVAGLLIAAALWLLGRLRLASPARLVAALLFGLAPMLAMDFVEYRLASFLGDAFDLALMFDLTGRQPDEMLAIAAPHTVVPGLAFLAVAAAAGALVWILQRLRASRAHTARLSGLVPLLAMALLVVALAATAVARDRSDVLDNGLRRKPSGKALGALLHAATDVDRDGFGVAGSLRDPAPFDSARFPYALDEPGNGIDENGVGGDLPGSLPAYVENPPAPATWTSRPDVVLIVLESFRADLVGSRVNGTPVTPALDALGSAGIVVPRALSHNGYTSQSRFHLMSGSLANLRDGRTLVDDFKAQGYEVGYFSGQDESFGGLPVGFERADVAYDARQDRKRRYTTFTTPGSLAVSHQIVRERLETFLAQRQRERPLFLYLNFHDTHYPYQHAALEPLVSRVRLAESQIAPGRSAELREMYANTAANVDRAIGETLALARRHLASPPAVIVTADHGESLFDEGFLGHGYALNDAQTRIPLIVSGLPLAIEEPFGQIDLRDAIRVALASRTAGAPPRVQPQPAKRVFQYLGNVDRPRQIAFADSSGRIIYDFRTRQVQVGGEWRTPAALDPDSSRRFHELVHFWERVALARHAARGANE